MRGRISPRELLREAGRRISRTDRSICRRSGRRKGEDREGDRQIAFWIHVARNAYNGRDWTAQAHIAFHNETGANYRQISRSLTLLRQKGFITSEQYMFQGKNLNRYRLTPAGEAVFAISGVVAKSEHPQKKGGDQIWPPGVAKSGHPGVATNVVLITDLHYIHTNSHTSLGGLTSSENSEEDQLHNISEEDEDMNLKSLIGASPESIKKACEEAHKPDKKAVYEIAWTEGSANIPGPTRRRSARWTGRSCTSSSRHVLPAPRTASSPTP